MNKQKLTAGVRPLKEINVYSNMNKKPVSVKNLIRKFSKQEKSKVGLPEEYAPNEDDYRMLLKGGANERIYQSYIGKLRSRKTPTPGGKPTPAPRGKPPSPGGKPTPVP